MESKGRCPESVSPCCVTFAVRGSAGRQEDLLDGLRNEHHRHWLVMSGDHRRAGCGGVYGKLLTNFHRTSLVAQNSHPGTPRCRGWRKVFFG